MSWKLQIVSFVLSVLGAASLSAQYGGRGNANDPYQTSTAQHVVDFENTWKMDADKGYAVLQNTIIIPEVSFWEKLRTQKVISDTLVDWVNFGPGMSGYNEEFWCHPTDTNTMFMGPDMHVSYGTWDNGQSWLPLKDYDGTGLDMQRVLDIQFSLQDPDFGVAIERAGGVLVSQDRGRSWTKINDIGKAHTRIAIHPENDSIWFIGAGDFWNVKANHRTAAKPHGIIQNRANYGYVLKTIDRGQNWKKVATTISSDLDVGRIIFNPNHPDSMIMAAGQGMFISGDAGETWTSSATGLPNNLPRDLTFYYNKDTKEFVLYTVEQTVFVDKGNTVDSKGGIYNSLNGGKSWQNISGNIAFDLNTITNYWARDGFHKAVAYWFGITKAAAKSKYTVYPSSTLSVYNRIVVNPLNKNEIYISHNKKHDKGFGPGEVWKTADGGTRWIVCARDGEYWINGEDKSYWQAKGNPTGANIEFSHVQREMDHGNESAGNRHMQINSIGQLWIGVAQQTQRSDNGGASWYQVDDFETALGSNKWIGRGASNLPGRYMLLETGIPDRYLLCSGEHGLWQTTDIGDWPDKDAVAVEQIEGQVHEGGSHSTSTVAVHPNDPNTIYILSWRQSHRGKLRRTTDGGKNWENIATIFDSPNNSWEALATQYSLMIDPVNPNNMYFTAIYKPISEVGGGAGPELSKGEYGVYRSFDGGYTWNVSNADFPAKSSINRLVMHPDNPEVFYAAMNQWGTNDDFGLYKSTDKTVSWTKMSIPSAIKSVNSVFIDRNNKYMYITCGSRSGAFASGGVYRSKDDGANWEKIFHAPYVWQCESSPVNPDLLVVTVPLQIPNMADDFPNPGIYLSRDAGETWLKINRNLAHSDKMVDVRFDPYNENILWAAGWGSGWYKGIIKSNSVKAVSSDVEAFENSAVTLYGMGSIGSQLSYEWIYPEGITTTSTNKYNTTFISPEVDTNTQFTFKLVVSNSQDQDTTEVKVTVKNDDTPLSKISRDRFHIFPNPVSKTLHFDASRTVLKADVFNLEGKKMHSAINKQNLNVSKLNNGMYFLQLATADGLYTQRFVKQ